MFFVIYLLILKGCIKWNYSSVLGLKRHYSDWWLAVLGFFLDEIHLRQCSSLHLVSLPFRLYLRQLKHLPLLYLLWLIFFLSEQVYQELLDLIFYILGSKPKKSSFASILVFDALQSQNFYLGRRKKKKGENKKAFQTKQHWSPSGILQQGSSPLPGCWTSPDVCTFPSAVASHSAGVGLQSWSLAPSSKEVRERSFVSISCPSQSTKSGELACWRRCQKPVNTEITILQSWIPCACEPGSL